MSELKRFPIQVKVGRAHGKAYIPWEIAEEAYAVYSGKYGTSQSLERLAERGGFSDGELDIFIPGWRERVEPLNAAKSRIQQLEAEAATLREALEDIVEQCKSDFIPCSRCGNGEDLEGCYIQDTAEKALSTTAGADALEVLRKANEWFYSWGDECDSESTADQWLHKAVKTWKESK